MEVDKKDVKGSIYTVIRILSIIFIIFLIVYLISIGLPVYIVIFPSFILSVLIWQSLLSDIGITDVTIDSNMFYFKQKTKGIKFKDITSIDLLFSEYRSGQRGKDANYNKVTVKLRIKVKDRKRAVNIDTSLQKESVWKIIEGCRNFNMTSSETIRVGDEIPDCREDYNNLLLKWKMYENPMKQEVLKLISKMYSKRKGLTIEESEEYIFKKEYQLRRRFSVFLTVLFILISVYMILG